MRPAVFLDRDGTVNVDTGYVSRACDVILIPGAAKAIARLNAAAIPVVIVTNQSGIGRGLLRREDYARVRDRVGEMLRDQGEAHVDATYECPHDPRVGECACRKPGTALFVRAALDLGLALDRSWYVGDRRRRAHGPRSGAGRRHLERSRRRGARVARAGPVTSSGCGGSRCWRRGGGPTWTPSRDI